ncbi:fenitrothion hydrolase [Paraconexibacter sp.]|uniref:fenitrothion hydrolase n=1 Tax=Paraconexibacter sp. TaxID=2949640 RepID=UPI00356439F8
MRRPVPTAFALALAFVLLTAGAADPAFAHGIVGKQDLPIPRWLFAWGAAVVLVVSFVALAVLWPQPRLERSTRRERPVVRVPVAAEVACGVVGVALFVLVVYAGLAGTQTEAANIAPTLVYVLFWVGLPFLSLLFGDVFRALNPWRAVARAVAWVAGRAGGGALPEPMDYPSRLGRWPAAAGILVFAWVELVSSSGGDPSTLAVLALVYAATQIIGMSIYGIEPWTRNADPFAVYFGLFASLSPAHWQDRRLSLRRPLVGATEVVAGPGTVALLAVMIGTTSFDGFSGGETWSNLAPDLQRFFVDLGFSQSQALEVAFTIGMLGVVLLVAGLYRLGIAGMRTIGGGADSTALGRRFAHTLIPIALAYVVAHYFSLLVYQGQAIGFLASDPLGDGSDLLGTADATIDYDVVGPNGVWYVQVGALVVGHVAGLVLAHERALVLYRKARDATRSQYWMLAVMVGFTSLGLWLLSAQAT